MKNNMLTDNPVKSLILFSLPILGGNLLQQLYSIIDTIIVGNFVSANALASVGNTGPIIFMITCVSSGLSNGASILIGQNFGASGNQSMKRLAITSLIYSIIAAVLITIIGTSNTANLIELLGTPTELVDGSITYLKIYFSGLIFIFGFNMISAIFRSMGDSKTPLIFLGVASITNIVLDLIFVIVFKMGITGVAIATVISQTLAFLLQLGLLIKRIYKYPKEKRVFDIDILRQLTKLALPTTSQEILISVGIFITQFLTNKFGPDVVAGYTATLRLTDLVLLPIINIGIGLTVFTAQNIGAGQVERVKEGYKSSLKITLIFGIFMGIVVTIFSRPLMQIFLGSNINEQIFDAGRSYLIVSSVTFLFMAVIFPAEGVLKGSGDVNLFMYIALFGSITKVLGAVILIPHLGYNGIWLGMAIGWAAEALLTVLRYKSCKWENKKIEIL